MQTIREKLTKTLDIFNMQYGIKQVGKVNVNLYSAFSSSPRLRYDTRSQGISQFYLHTPRTSANGMNHTCICLLSRSWYSFTDPGGMEG